MTDREAALLVIEKTQRERDEARAEVERMKARITEVGVMVAKNGNGMAAAAYRRGAEAMREAAAQLFDGIPNVPGLASMPLYAEVIRALPVPEDKA